MLFGVLSVVSRPFEAHLFKHGYRKPANAWHPPYSSHGSPITGDRISTCEKSIHYRHMPTSTHRSSSSDPMAQNRSRSPGSVVFTLHHAPPPIPSAFMTPHRNPSFDALPSASYASTTHGVLTGPPLSSHSASRHDSAPVSTQARYSASIWRAVHPESPEFILHSSRPRPYSRDLDLSHRQSLRSSMSLTRPSRLSSLKSISQSDSTVSESRDHCFGVTDEGDRATPGEIAYAITNGTPIPGTEPVKGLDRHHICTVSAPNNSSAAQKNHALVFDAIVVTRKPVPVRRLRSADCKRASDTSNTEAENYMINQRLRNFSYPNGGLAIAEFKRSRRMTFEEVKNKPLPKIAVF